MTVTSEPGKGSVFTVRLPKATDGKTGKAQDERCALVCVRMDAGLGQKRILIDFEPLLCGSRDRIGNRIIFALDAYLSLPQGPAIYIRSTHWERDGPG